MIKFFADYLLVIILAVSAGVLVWDGVKKGRWRLFPYVIMAGLTALLVAKFSSLVYQPSIARPFLEKGVAPGAAFINNPGFPSDHALLGAVAVLAVYAVTRRRYLSLILALGALLMMAARVLALVHTPLDVLGGTAAAFIGAVWYAALPKEKKA